MKQIIILGVVTSSILQTINCLMWYPITSGKLVTGGASAWSGASAAENTAISNGSVLEESTSFAIPTGLPTASIKAYLVQYWTNRNAAINGIGPALYNGVYDDSGTGWSA